MHCVNCGYLLFNLTRPVCPECGTSFSAADYAFPPGSVEYLCPRCQTTVGTPDSACWSAREERRLCPGCAGELDATTVMVRPTRAGVEGLLLDSVNARAHAMSIGQWWWVCGKSMSTQLLFFRNRARQSNKDAWWFALLTGFVVTNLCGLFWGIGLLGLAAMRGDLGVLMMAPLSLLAALMLSVVVGVGAPVLAGVLLAAPAHLALMALAPRRCSLNETYRTACYALGPMVLSAVPVIGVFVALPWTLIAFARGLHAVHRVRIGVAVLAALWLPVLCTGVYLVL
ncbi:MAG: YIP1 family protein [Phycisphaerae bacterium]|nr:YIP1 family protein [Phycisphaerae bacterium]